MEGDAGASRLTPNDTDEDPSLNPDPVADDPTAEETAEDSLESDDATDHEITESDAEDLAEVTDVESDPRGTSRLGRGWFIGIAAAFVVLAGGLGAGGYFVALRSHLDSQATARHDVAAVEAAKDCVGATQAPDTGRWLPARRRSSSAAPERSGHRRSCTAVCSSRPIKPPTLTSRCLICVLQSSETTPTVRSRFWCHCG